MAPHWKCGSGKPVAGSNPALSATARRADGPSCRLLRRDRPCFEVTDRASHGDPAADGPATRLASRTRGRPGTRPPDPILDRQTGVSFGRRARRGTSGALYLQSATAGLNPLPRSPFSNAARRRDVEDRVPRSGEPRTVSGPEGSSTKRSSSGAAERPGPSRSSWWARERPGRRRVHGTSFRLPAPDRRRS
jgi:hypothetical protein